VPLSLQKTAASTEGELVLLELGAEATRIVFV
jgi:hypothetical protein